MTITQSDLIEEVARLSAVAERLAEENHHLRLHAIKRAERMGLEAEELRLLRALEEALRDYLKDFSGRAWCRIHEILKQLEQFRGTK